MNNQIIQPKILLTDLMNPQNFKDADLEELPPWPDEMILKGPIKHWEKAVHIGEEIVGVIYKATAGEIYSPGYPFDQSVVILEGSLILIPEGGDEIHLKKGDIFQLPKGYKGKWIMPEDYKEYIVVEKKSWLENQ